MEKILVSLIIEYEDGKIEKLKMKNSKGEIYEEISLATLDYMLASYSSLERYLEVAFQYHWVTSSNANLKIVGIDGTEYPLPFTTKYNDIIYKCSESATFKGQGQYIEKGDETKMVSNMEFQDFFQTFTSNILDEEGYELLEQGYFHKFLSFENLLKEYYDLSQKEDDMYASSKASRLEKDLSFIRTPRTIDDYLRNYPVFRLAVSFNEVCEQKRKENKKKEAEKKIKVKKTKGKKVIPEHILKKNHEKNEASYYAGNRSLCYIIGNNCEPLILKTMEANELDCFIVEHYKEPKEIRRAYREQIEAYILEHKEYVTKIRNLINNPRYSGQLSILAHDRNGHFIRTSEGAYLRYPILYSDCFKSIRDLYCNIDKFRKQVVKLRSDLQRVEYKLQTESTYAKQREVEEKFHQVLQQLEQEKKVTKEQLGSAMDSIKKIMEDMKDLESFDYEKSVIDPSYRRIFSKQASNTVRFVEGTIPRPGYKKILDSWLVAISNSSRTDYDQIRIILRELRKKIDVKEYEFPVMDQPDDYRLNAMNSGHIMNVYTDEPEEEEKSESFLSTEELEEMYGEVPDESVLRSKNIHVYK